MLGRIEVTFSRCQGEVRHKHKPGTMPGKIGHKNNRCQVKFRQKTFNAMEKTSTNPLYDLVNRDPKLLNVMGNSSTGPLDAREIARTKRLDAGWM